MLFTVQSLNTGTSLQDKSEINNEEVVEKGTRALKVTKSKMVCSSVLLLLKVPGRLSRTFAIKGNLRSQLHVHYPCISTFCTVGII